MPCSLIIFLNCGNSYFQVITLTSCLPITLRSSGAGGGTQTLQNRGNLPPKFSVKVPSFQMCPFLKVWGTFRPSGTLNVFVFENSPNFSFLFKGKSVVFWDKFVNKLFLIFLHLDPILGSK